MGMGYEEIGDIFKQWNASGELVCFCTFNTIIRHQG
jgi:hypothetical protein